MSSDLGELTIEDAAKAAAGNWKRFDSFAWFGASERERPDEWFIYYGHHRESGLLDRSNSEQISKALKRFIDADTDDPDVIGRGSFALGGWLDQGLVSAGLS